MQFYLQPDKYISRNFYVKEVISTEFETWLKPTKLKSTQKPTREVSVQTGKQADATIWVQVWILGFIFQSHLVSSRETFRLIDSQ